MIQIFTPESSGLSLGKSKMRPSKLEVQSDDQIVHNIVKWSYIALLLNHRRTIPNSSLHHNIIFESVLVILRCFRMGNLSLRCPLLHLLYVKSMSLHDSSLIWDVIACFALYVSLTFMHHDFHLLVPLLATHGIGAGFGKKLRQWQFPTLSSQNSIIR